LVLSQTRFLLACTGELALTGCWKINNLAPLPGPKIALKNAYTSSLRHVWTPRVTQEESSGLMQRVVRCGHVFGL
jgi:hypothetical protein